MAEPNAWAELVGTGCTLIEFARLKHPSGAGRELSTLCKRLQRRSLHPVRTFHLVPAGILGATLEL
jgi:hypothetical protein